MLQRQRLRQIPVHDSGGLGQGGRAGQHVLYRAQQAAVGARITTQQQQQRQHQQENLAQPSVRGNIALVALIVPVLLVVIGAGIWWWWRRRTRRFGKGGGHGGNDDLATHPRVAREIPALPDERELQKRGVDIGGRWGPTLRWWWIERARARGELSTTTTTTTTTTDEADHNDSPRRGAALSDGGGDDMEMHNVSQRTTVAAGSRGTSKSAAAQENDNAKTHMLSAAAGVRPQPQPHRQHPVSRVSSASSLASRPEPVRDVLWWEGIDFDDED